MMNRLVQRLEGWREEGRIAALDARFGLFLAEGSGSEALGLLGAVVSRQRGLGHVCLDPRLPPDDLPGLDLDTAWNEMQAVPPPWLGRSLDDWSPLVLDAERLYLGRLHAAETALAERVRRWSTAGSAPPPDPDLVRRLFPDDGPGSADQRLAAALAAIRPFTVITGGPGTGKTTTVVRVLAMRLATQADLAIRLLAPTGKAAARLSESLAASKARLDLPEDLVTRIPERVTTVHRFLGLGHGRPRYDRHHPAPVNLVVLDEASMIDLPTMHRLVEALPETAALILLGDPDQLASVEAGSVLADLVAPARPDAFTAGVKKALQAAGIRPPPEVGDARPLDDSLVRLTWSHRFSAERGIGKLAALVREGEANWDALLTIAEAHEEIEVSTWQGERLSRDTLDDFLDDLNARDHDTVEGALQALGRARVLCALRRGPAGVETLNALVAERLDQPRERHAHGHPVLVTRNAPALGVYNGDMGVLWKEEDETAENGFRLRACFPAEGGQVHRLPLAELPEHEPAYALTVHKSQGSEYDRVLLILPPEPHPLVTRELIYTALTRAKTFVRIVAAPESWNAGVERRTRRASGLADRL